MRRMWDSECGVERSELRVEGVIMEKGEIGKAETLEC